MFGVRSVHVTIHNYQATSRLKSVVYFCRIIARCPSIILRHSCLKTFHFDNLTFHMDDASWLTNLVRELSTCTCVSLDGMGLSGACIVWVQYVHEHGLVVMEHVRWTSKSGIKVVNLTFLDTGKFG